MKKREIIIIIFSFLILGGLIFLGKTGNYARPLEEDTPTEPATPVKRFIELDLLGVRINSYIADQYPNIYQYSYPDSIYEGDQLSVIDKYEIVNEYKSGESYFVEIDYFCIYIVDSNLNKFKCRKIIDTVSFELKKDQDNYWKIISPGIHPRISEETLEQHLKYLED